MSRSKRKVTTEKPAPKDAPLRRRKGKCQKGVGPRDWCGRERCRCRGEKKERRTLASRADKHRLYQKSVQNPKADLDFAEAMFSERFGRTPTLLREDFCGTALTCSKWVKRRPKNQCWGVDLDPEPLEWGRQHNLSRLTTELKSRVTLIQGDVLTTSTPPSEVILSQNFSFCIFKTRAQLRRYFAQAYAGLADQGILVLDIFGGPDSQMPGREKTRHKNFVYVWDQASYDAVTSEIQCHIHFQFKDGSRLKKAFSYDWRLWTISELRELLLETGFDHADAYWEGTDKDGGGDGVFTHACHADNEDAWVAYVIGTRGGPG